MISPLSLRSSLCQEGFAKTWGQSTRSLRRQDAEQCPPGRQPCKRPLENADGETALVQITHRESEERAVRGEIGAEENGTGLNARYLQYFLEKSRGYMQHGNRFPRQWQCRGKAVELHGVSREREMAGPAPRSGSQLRQVHGQPLLQFTGPT